MKFLLTYHFYSRGKQQIHEQIQKRLEDRSMQEEMEKLERQQDVEKQEKAHLEDLKVPPTATVPAAAPFQTRKKQTSEHKP